MLGTTWVAPGTGSTVAEITAAVLNFSNGMPPTRTQRAVIELERMVKATYKTRLFLTGRALTPYDLERIESLPDWTKDEIAFEEQVRITDEIVDEIIEEEKA